MIVTLEHARSLPCVTNHGMCSRGLRAFCDRHNIDWRDFITNGIEEERLLATGDAMALKLVQWANQYKEK